MLNLKNLIIEVITWLTKSIQKHASTAVHVKANVHLEQSAKQTTSALSMQIHAYLAELVLVHVLVKLFQKNKERL